ncbi:AbiH family protein [Telluribacter sp. SYSU D00476]|uniref:AbiH family protein n=1 Tax=Telluribacter sp. SYSU D00476 TaxID=2811430 RepID=UPI001FF35C8C|nr:AbiH family protein [Telluribacter sp. SYSU D00476]
MNRIVILGNGFDIAHGLATGYRDFIRYLSAQFIDFLNSNSEEQRLRGHKLFYLTPQDSVHLYNIKPIQAYSITKEPFSSWEELWDRLWIEYDDGRRYRAQVSCTNWLLGYVFNSSNIATWGGFENDYKDVLTNIMLGKAPTRNGFIPNDYTVERLNKDLGEIIELLYSYLKEQITIPNTLDPSILSRLLTEPLREWRVNQTFIPTYGEIPLISRHHVTERLENVLFLSFNYTSTIQNYLFNEVNFDAIDACDLEYNSRVGVTTSLRYIHGDLNDNNPRSLIFGYGDELDENQALLETLNDEFLRHIKSVLYTRSPYYREVIDFSDAGQFDIIIYGHSCSNTDRTLLNTLFEHENCVSIQPYLHNENDMSIYTNIYRCFKDKKLMRSRVVDQTNTIRGWA